MKLPTNKTRPGAYTLLELIVYMGVYAMLLGLALLAFYKCCDHYSAMRRQSDDIARATRAGEIWRRDVRTATAAIRFDDADRTVRIPHPGGVVAYRFDDTTVYRQANAESPWAILLPRVRASSMQAETRKHAAAWRWEVELQSKKSSARVRPVFTFLSATPEATTP